MSYDQLRHVRRPLKHGGQVVVLDTGALITAEADAMLQALHSRSIGGVEAHLVKLAQRGAAKFMETYYVGYGDKSIGDCGTTTIFIEGVSLLAAKAIQDSQLYNGQESSTRYIDYSKQPFLNPRGSEVGNQLLESLRAFYLEGLETMKAELKTRHPRQEGENEAEWTKAINARAFDVMRGFLPAGAATNLTWHTELRHAVDHLLRLRHHPLEEVREIAEATHSALDEKYPNSFKQKRYEWTEEYVRKWMSREYYFNPAGLLPGVVVLRDAIDRHQVLEYREVLTQRPKKAELPKQLGECGTVQFRFNLDYGSFRDLQRHRSLIQRMPLLTFKHGFEEWYLDQMPQELRQRAKGFLHIYRMGVMRMGVVELDDVAGRVQYYIPIGYRVTNQITGDLPALVWVVELRSGSTVHPTLRIIAQEIGTYLKNAFGAMYGLTLYIDETPDRFSIKRGTHDIIEKS